MNQSDIAQIRLFSQQLAGTKFSSPKDLVTWMGAMQAQDYPMAKWAFGVRLQGLTDLDVEAAITRGDILRTHLLRPTWHFVTPEDIGWLIDLTAPQIKAGQSARDRQLELTEDIYSKSNRLIENALSTGRHLTREELIPLLNQGGIATDQNRASHLFMRAELEKIICSGATRKGKITYALFSKRASHPRQLTREEALAELATRYFTSRCPATQQDFTWWSGLRAADVSIALELVRPAFITETLDGRTFWLPTGYTPSPFHSPTLCLLPTYDEFVISYADRGASIPPSLEQHMKEISDRGVFWPLIVVDGKVEGTWKRTLKKNTMLIEIHSFYKLDRVVKELVGIASSHFGNFVAKTIDIAYIA